MREFSSSDPLREMLGDPTLVTVSVDRLGRVARLGEGERAGLEARGGLWERLKNAKIVLVSSLAVEFNLSIPRVSSR